MDLLIATDRLSESKHKSCIPQLLELKEHFAWSCSKAENSEATIQNYFPIRNGSKNQSKKVW